MWYNGFTKSKGVSIMSNFERKLYVCEEYLRKGILNKHVAKFLFNNWEYSNYDRNVIRRYYKMSKGKSDTLGGYDLSFKLVAFGCILSLLYSMFMPDGSGYSSIAILTSIMMVVMVVYGMTCDMRGRESELSDRYYKYCVGTGRV